MSSLVTGVQTCALPILALIAVGAFRPRVLMSGNHIGPEEAVDVSKALGAESAIGVHWGTFQLSREAVHEQREALDEVLQRGDRKSDVEGKRVTVRVEPGGRRIIKKKKQHPH